MNEIIYEKVKEVNISCSRVSKEIDQAIERREKSFIGWLQIRTWLWSNTKRTMLISLFALGFLSCYATVLMKTIKWENKQASISQKKTINEPMVMSAEETKNDLFNR